MSPDELDIRAMKAVLLFNDGWSIHMAMSQAGFGSNWNTKKEIVQHPLVKTIRAMNQDNKKNKKHFNNRLPILGS